MGQGRVMLLLSGTNTPLSTSQISQNVLHKKSEISAKHVKTCGLQLQLNNTVNETIQGLWLTVIRYYSIGKREKLFFVSKMTRLSLSSSCEYMSKQSNLKKKQNKTRKDPK